MAITARGELGEITATSAGTTLAVPNSTGAIIPAGTLIHITGAWDSINTATAPTITCSTIGGATAIANHGTAVGSGATTTAGAGIWHACFRAVTTGNIAVGATIATLTSNQSAVKRAAHAEGFNGALATLRGTVTTAVSTTGSPTVTTTGTALVVGDLVIGSVSFENNAQMTADADTSGGPWPPIVGVFTTGGGAATNVGSGSQYKILTATGTQTFNPTGGVADTVACVYSVQPEPEPTITQAAYRFYADGTETGSTALAAQNTGYTADLSSGDANLQVRVLLQSTNATTIPATDDFQLQWEKNTSGTWTNVAPFQVGGLNEGYPASNFANVASLYVDQSKVGQSFLGNGQRLSQAGFHLAKSGTPTGTLIAELYAHAGTFGTNGAPTGAALATSTTSLAATSISATASMVSFTFNETFTLVNGTPYFIVVTAVGGSTFGNHIAVSNDDSTPTHPGNHAAFGTFWVGDGTKDAIFELWTQPASVATTAVAYASTNLTDAAATTNRLTGGTGAFAAGKVSEDGLADDLGWAGTNYTEVLFSVTLKQADLANSDTVRFRVLRNGVTTGLTYTQTPTVTVSLAAVTGGASTGALALVGAATGQRTPKATATTGALTLVGAAAGQRTPKATATTGAISWVGAGVGARAPRGTTSGALALVGAAAGAAPAVGGIWASTDFLGGAIGTDVTPTTEPIFMAAGNNPAPIYRADAAGTGQAMETIGAFSYLALGLGSRGSTGTAHFRVAVDVHRVALLSQVSAVSYIFVLANGATNVGDVILRRNANATSRQFAMRANFVYQFQVGGIGNTSTGEMVDDGENWHVEYEVNGTTQSIAVWLPTNATTTPNYTGSGAITGTYDRVQLGDNSASGLQIRLSQFRASDGPQIRTAPPEEGSAAGAITWAGTATGQRTPKATSTGALSFVGLAAGTRTPKGTATTGAVVWVGTAAGAAPTVGVSQGSSAGTITWAGTASGARTPKAAVTGALSYVGTAVGKRTPQATSSGVVNYVGTAAGTRTPKATSTGVISWVGTASGTRTPKASSTGAVTWTGAAVGSKAQRGSSTGAVAWVGAAAGARTSRASGTGVVAWVGLAAGKRTPKGASTAGLVTWSGTASGVAPIVGVEQGSATGFLLWAGTGTGKRTPKASGTGVVAWIGTASGSNPQRGSSTGALTWAGSAAGVFTATGQVVGAITWAGIALAGATRAGGGVGAISWVGAATGTAPVLGANGGEATGAITWAGAAVGWRVSSATTAGTLTWQAVAVGIRPAQDNPTLLFQMAGQAWALQSVGTGWMVTGDYPAWMFTSAGTDTVLSGHRHPWLFTEVR